MKQQNPIWHVSVTVSGDRQPVSETRRALDQFQQERPFLHSLRYGESRVEFAYWEEAGDVVDAASLALRVWDEHRESAALPPWQVVGLEVVDLETFQSRQSAPSLAQARAVPRRF
ncbi:MAG: hypothetical protein H0T14_01585 [Nocardioidaceae bacterium]|nr:hypothetical protein [Nocardioidaceae bacterium]